MKQIVNMAVALSFAVFVADVVFATEETKTYPVVPSSFPYDVKPSGIVPAWSGAQPGEWTFDYETAFANAKRDGKYTLLLFTGMWWCPHCQALETRALLKDEFKDYVAEQGYYLAAVDFPYRDGTSNWCWLWDPGYRAVNGIGDWTPEDVAKEIIKRFEYQNSWTKGGAVTTNNNVLVYIDEATGVTNMTSYTETPTTVYQRVGYPTIIVIDPNGVETGRFSFSFRNVPDEEALDYVIGNIEMAKSGAGADTALFAKPETGGLLGTAATTYVGWLEDADGVVAGSISVKAAKVNKKTGGIKLTATVQPTGGKKVTYTGTGTISTNAVISLAKKGSVNEQLFLKLGADGMTGVVSGGAERYSIQGGRDVFKAKDKVGKDAAAAVAKGCWSIVLETVADGGSAFAHGYSGLSVTVGNKGKVKVAGTLGDGTSAKTTAQAIVGENGVVCVPVMASLYSKKGGYSMLLTFSSGQLVDVSGISSWKAVGKPATFTATWSETPNFGVTPGAGDISSEMTLDIAGFDDVSSLGGSTIAISPNASAVAASGSKWTGVKGISDLKVTYKTKDLTFKGSLNVYVTDSRGKLKKIKGTLSGVVVRGVPYGTLVIKDVGTWAVLFASSCGGGDGC